MATITTALVRDAKPRAKVYELTCSGLPGFLLRVLPTGKKVFVVRHWVNGKDHRTRIGLWSPELTVDEARRRAAVILGGGDVGVPAIPPESEPIEQVRAPKVTRMQRREAVNSSVGPVADPEAPEPSEDPDPDLDLADGLAASPAHSRRPLHAVPQPAHEHSDERGPSAARAFIPPPLRVVSRPSSPATTLAALSERFYSEYVDVYLKPRTALNYRHYMSKFILLTFGDRDFMDVSRSEVRALHARLRDNPAAADYVLCVLGSLYTRIVKDWELADIRNPVSGTRRYGSRRVERFLTPDERRNLQTVIETGLRIRPGRPGHVDLMTAWTLQLLALTGLRRDEIVGLKWPMIDWQHAVLNLPDTKTGQRSVPVSSQVMAVLREIREHVGPTASGYVVTSRNGRRLTSLNKTWERIRVAAGIPDVRLHDLRHSFASDALMGGVPLAVIGKILGHRQASTTQRYAHLSDNVVRNAIEHTASRIADAGKPLVVVPPPPPPFKALTNSQWAKVAPIVCAGRSPRAQAPLRKTVDGIRWVLHHKAAWRDIPSEYGSYTSCWRWHSRWHVDDTWIRVIATLEKG